MLETSQSKSNRFGLVLYLPELTRKAKSVIARASVCVHTCMPMCTPFLSSNYARALGASGVFPKEGFCRWVQLLLLLGHVSLDPFRSSGFRVCYNKPKQRSLPRFLPKPWFLVPSVLNHLCLEPLVVFLLCSIHPWLLPVVIANSHSFREEICDWPTRVLCLMASVIGSVIDIYSVEKPVRVCLFVWDSCWGNITWILTMKSTERGKCNVERWIETVLVVYFRSLE